MRQLASWALAIAFVCPLTHAQERKVVPSPLRSGSSDMSADLRAMQADDFANPGML